MLAVDTIALMDALEIEQPILAGFDGGARTANVAQPSGRSAARRSCPWAPTRTGCRHQSPERGRPGLRRRLRPEEGERLIDVEGASKDSVLNAALVPLYYPTGQGAETAVEFAINAARAHDALAADLPPSRAAVMAATQRPAADLAFSEPSSVPAWRTLPAWTVVATSDRAAGSDVIRSMAQRVVATITEVEGSPVIWSRSHRSSRA